MQLRFRHIVRNVFSNWVGTAANMAVGFFLSPYIVHHLGNVAYGIWVLAISSVGYLGMLDLGMRSSVLRFVSRARTVGDHSEASEAVSSALWVRLQVSVLVLLISAGLAFEFPTLFHVSGGMARAAQIAVMIVGFNLAITMSMGVFGGVISGLNRYDLQTAIQLGQLVIRVTGVLLVLKTGHGIVAIALCESAAALVGNVALVLVSKRIYPELRVRLKSPDKAMLRSLWGYSMYAFMNTVAMQLVYQTDNLVIGAFVSAGAVALYAIGASLVRYTEQFTGALTMSFVPAASTFEAAGDASKLRALYSGGTRALLALALPILTTLLTRGRTFLGLWMGPQFQGPSGTIMMLLAGALMFPQANCAAFAIAFGTGQHKISAKWQMVEGIANLGLSVILVRFYGIYGVALGTVIPNLFVHLVLWPSFTSKMIGIRKWDIFTGVWGPMFLSAVPFAIASHFADVHFRPTTVVGFFVQTLALLPVFLAAVAIVFRKEIQGRGMVAVKSFLQQKAGTAA